MIKEPTRSSISSSIKRSTSKVELTVQHLIEGIRKGDYAPGQRLVESNLTHVLGISRGPLREAMRILATKDILEVIPNRGARIKQLHKEDLHQRFQLLQTLGSVAIENLTFPLSTEITPPQAPFPAGDENSTSSNEHISSLFKNVVEYYCYLARLSHNSLLADYIFNLNLAYLSPHTLHPLNLNGPSLDNQFNKVKEAVQAADASAAQQEHHIWCQQILNPSDSVID